jgi:hypothetical protein
MPKDRLACRNNGDAASSIAYRHGQRGFVSVCHPKGAARAHR